jgi:hypothetical protein
LRRFGKILNFYLSDSTHLDFLTTYVFTGIFKTPFPRNKSKIGKADSLLTFHDSLMAGHQLYLTYKVAPAFSPGLPLRLEDYTQIWANNWRRTSNKLCAQVLNIGKTRRVVPSYTAP